MRGIFGGGFGRGLAFGHFPKLAWIVIKPRRPGAQPRHMTELILPAFSLWFATHQRILRARNNRDVGAANQFQHAQSMRDLVVEPLVAGHNRDSKYFDLRRLNHEEDRLLIGASRAGSVLINDDFLFGLRPALPEIGRAS